MSWQDHRYAPAAGSLLCPLEAVPDEGCKELRFGPGDAALSLILYRRADRVRAYVNSCPHFSLPLNARPDDFLLLSGARVMCAWHCAVFRLDDGHCTAGPAEGMGLEGVPVHLRDGQVVLGMPET